MVYRNRNAGIAVAPDRPHSTLHIIHFSFHSLHSTFHFPDIKTRHVALTETKLAVGCFLQHRQDILS